VVRVAIAADGNNGGAIVKVVHRLVLIAVVLGGVIGRFVPEKVIKIVSAAVFIGFGVLTLVETFRK